MGLISFESYIKVFIYLLCGNGDLLRQIDAEKRGLGYILNNLSGPVPGREIGSVRRPVRGSVRHAAPLPERNHALPERHRRL